MKLVDITPFPKQGFYERDAKKYECGLYPDGRNDMPATHRKAGEELAASIVPDAKTGRISILVAGHSNPKAYFSAYAAYLAGEQGKRHVRKEVELLNICEGGKMSRDWAAECCAPGPRGARQEAQVLFLLTSLHNSNRDNTARITPDVLQMSLEERTKALKEDLKAILQGFARACPQLKLAYLGCDTWRGNSGLEPMVWEEAFAFKGIIEDQINGDPELAYAGLNRKAPWVAWGGYIWENNPPKERFEADGVHPSEAGKAFAYGCWHDLLVHDSTAIPWLSGKQNK
ncbi:MAG: hypothetical protein WC789_03595 [Lentisphaeria bacterium]|jgi:hypothetical protein